MTKSRFCMFPPSVPNIGFHPRILFLLAEAHWCNHAKLWFVFGGQVVNGLVRAAAKGQTVTTDLYSQQLEYVQLALKWKESALNHISVLFLPYNASPHVARQIRDTIHRLCWETLYYSLYSFDCTPFDYHLFHSLNNHLSDQTSFTNEVELCTFNEAFTVFFASKAPPLILQIRDCKAGDTLRESIRR